MTPASKELNAIVNMIQSLVRDRTLNISKFLFSASNYRSRLALELSVRRELTIGMSSSELEQVVKAFLEARFGVALDYLAIEGQMSPDTNGDMGVTGSYRKRTGDKNTFFTVTVNLTSHKIQNLQEY